MTSILKKEQYRVWDEGTLVCVRLGNVELKMDYNDALEIAQCIRLHGHRAKNTAGDRSFTMRARGILRDAGAEELRLQSIRDATAAFK